jgi:hypothetical protein
MAEAVDNDLPLDVAATAVRIWAIAVSVWTAIIASSVVRAADYKSGTKSTTAVTILCVCRTSKANDRESRNRSNAYFIP